MSLAWYNMVNNQTSCVIVKVADCDYIYNVIVVSDYISSGNGDCDYAYDYWRSCNRLESITITDYDYSKPTMVSDCVKTLQISSSYRERNASSDSE